MEEWRNEVNKNSKGGTELMMERLYSTLPNDLLDHFQIIPSRVRELKDDKIRLLYLHDLPDDPESLHLADGGWQNFNKLIFVSHWQRDGYVKKFNIPWSRTVVMPNAIRPIPVHEKPTERLNIIYHTTPHRGLEILVPVFEHLAEKHENIHLHVYSSFAIYGWEVRDEPYKPLFDRIQNHERMHYYGAVSNDGVREALMDAYIFGFPSIWPETSCLALMEAMSAGCLCVHPNFAALPETAANLTYMYNFHEDPNKHAGQFYGMLENAIRLFEMEGSGVDLNCKTQKSYADLVYNWDNRATMWEEFLRIMTNEKPFPVKVKGKVFTYRT